jgi:hypothetical protein
MANMAASHNPDLPFPFPTLEAASDDGAWQAIPVVVGAPAGNTKTLLVDLQNCLPAGAHRLRLTMAFEIYWDRIALFERRPPGDTTIRAVPPERANLHWRGYSEYLPLPPDHPLTPNYERTGNRPPWRITPSGWATRYGEVGELIAASDNALALVAAGDELTVEFPALALPPIPPGFTRDYFLSLVGWDKDADVHVTTGSSIAPIPWHGMDDQAYGAQLRPELPNDDWMQRYNTRWIGPRPLARP